MVNATATAQTMMAMASSGGIWGQGDWGFFFGCLSMKQCWQIYNNLQGIAPWKKWCVG